ncbi:FAD-dependent oxidoreductase [Microbacterium sp. X-17]|uniref:NAD(P)/FAD-dependent oxidoreductase n=1 Tax=Microbacterium sp. X-17 TaxID=3144404 RepID=UPI0031F5BDB6
MDGIVVLGAGYAGVMAANRLAAQGEDVTVVTPQPWLVERIRLHRVASGLRDDARAPLAELLHPDVRVVEDTATRIDAANDAVELASGTVLPYGCLVYAVGSGVRDAALPASVHVVTDEAGALRLRGALAARPEATVRVIGAGLTGIELASVLAGSGRRVHVVTTSSLTATPSERAHARHLRGQGVVLETGRRATRDDAPDDEITVDTTGFHVPSLAADSGLPTDADGRLLVGADLAVDGIPNVFGAGDAARVDDPSGAHLRMACATALPMGAHAADAIRARAAGNPAPAFSLGYVLRCVDLGRADARAQHVTAEDEDRSFAVGGVAGGMIKEAICRMTLQWIRNERQRPGRFRWADGPRLAAEPVAVR